MTHISAQRHRNEIVGPSSRHEAVSAVRLTTALTAEIDAWAAEREISRAEAIEQLITLGLQIRRAPV